MVVVGVWSHGCSGRQASLPAYRFLDALPVCLVFLFVVEEVVSSPDELKTRTTFLWFRANVAADKFGFALTTVRSA